MKKYLLLLLLPFALTACDGDDHQPNDDKVSQPEKDGSVEVNLKVGKGETMDTLKISYNVWKQNQIVRSGVITDTLPTLGVTRETGEDSTGSEQTVTVPRNYNLFVTVK